MSSTRNTFTVLGMSLTTVPVTAISHATNDRNIATATKKAPTPPTAV